MQVCFAMGWVWCVSAFGPGATEGGVYRPGRGAEESSVTVESDLPTCCLPILWETRLPG